MIFSKFFGLLSLKKSFLGLKSKTVLSTFGLGEKHEDFTSNIFFILPPSKEILSARLSNRDMKDKLIVEERMKQFERDVLHWINYDYVVINDNLQDCYKRIHNLINAEISNGSKDYDLEYIRNHVEKLTT